MYQPLVYLQYTVYILFFLWEVAYMLGLWASYIRVEITKTVCCWLCYMPCSLCGKLHHSRPAPEGSDYCSKLFDNILYVEKLWEICHNQESTWWDIISYTYFHEQDYKYKKVKLKWFCISQLQYWDKWCILKCISKLTIKVFGINCV